MGQAYISDRWRHVGSAGGWLCVHVGGWCVLGCVELLIVDVVAVVDHGLLHGRWCCSRCVPVVVHVGCRWPYAVAALFSLDRSEKNTESKHGPAPPSAR